MRFAWTVSMVWREQRKNRGVTTCLKLERILAVKDGDSEAGLWAAQSSLWNASWKMPPGPTLSTGLSNAFGKLGQCLFFRHIYSHVCAGAAWPAGNGIHLYLKWLVFLGCFVQFLVLGKCISHWWGAWDVFKERRWKIKVKHEKVGSKKQLLDNEQRGSSLAIFKDSRKVMSVSIPLEHQERSVTYRQCFAKNSKFKK